MGEYSRSQSKPPHDSLLLSKRSIVPTISSTLGARSSSPIDVDAEVGVLADLQANVLLRVEKIVNHFVVDLEVAHRDKALGRVRC